MTLFYLTLAKICHTVPVLRRPFWRYVYQGLAKRYVLPEWTFMNYGYLPEGTDRISLDTADEADRNLITLYHEVASQVSLEGKDILEVGSGRGGGASYVARYLKPGSVIGVDISEQAVAFCRDRHKDVDGLSFQQGDAEALPFEERTFDVVLNVESSHCYGSIDQFFREAYRVLKTDGSFLYADFRPTEQVDAIRDAILKAGFSIRTEKDITSNVLSALAQDSETKEQWISDLANASLQTTLRTFAATSGTKLFSEFQSGALSYFQFHAQRT